MTRVGSRFESMQIQTDRELSPEQTAKLKRDYAKELLKDSRVKKDIGLDIDDISRQKGDLIAEIMRQYSLDKNPSESTYYHDQMCIIFDQCLWNVRVYVNAGRWEELGM